MKTFFISRIHDSCKSGWYIALANAFAAIATLSLWATLPDRTPTLVAEPSHYDFGPSQQNQSMHKEILLKNYSNDRIYITGIETSCGCSTTRLPQSIVDPAAAVPLEINWEMRNRRGAIRTKLVVHYRRKNGSAENLAVTLNTTVLPDYETKPSELVFDSTQKSRKLVIFTPNKFAGLKLISVRCSQQNFEAKILENENIVEVKFKPQNQITDPMIKIIGHENAFLRVETNSKNEPFHDIPMKIKYSD